MTIVTAASTNIATTTIINVFRFFLLLSMKNSFALRFFSLIGDVYKRQGVHNERGLGLLLFERNEHRLHLAVLEVKSKALDIIAVSYTHLIF